MIKNIIVGICSLLFIMIGLDKFILFLQPPCSMMESIHSDIWKGVGVLQLLAGVLIWVPKPRKYVAGFFFVFMLVFIIVHLSQGTNDIGGAVFMSILLGLLVWDPSFIRAKQQN